MLTDDQINENAAVIKKFLLMGPEEQSVADKVIINTTVDTITSMILAFHRIARADMFKP